MAERVGWEVVEIPKGQKSPRKISKLFSSKSSAEAFLAEAKKAGHANAYLKEVIRVRGVSIRI